MKSIFSLILLLYIPVLCAQFDIQTDYKIQGKLGVGTTTPSEKLDIDGNVRVRSRLFCNGSDFVLGNLDFRNQGARLGNRALVHTDWGIGTDNLNINFDGDFEGGVEIGGPKLIVSGNIGLGENNPQVKLHLSNDNKMRIGPWEFSQEGGGNTISYFRIDRYTSDGTTISKNKLLALDWAGNLNVKKVTVSVDQFPDYVFENSYSLMPLLQLEKFINKNKHLPDVPTANEIEKEGMDVGEMNKILLKKIEELTLYVIQQQKQIDELVKLNQNK